MGRKYHGSDWNGEKSGLIGVGGALPPGSVMM